MLDKKKVVSSDKGQASNGQDVTKPSLISTAATSKNDKKGMGAAAGGLNNLKTMLRAKRHFTGSSMMNLVKTQENKGAGVAAKGKAPMLFGAYRP